MILTRIASLDKWKNVLAGRDLGNMFEEGYVYAGMKAGNDIVFTKLGKHAQMPYFYGQPIDVIYMDGSHLLTEDEYKLKLELQEKQKNQGNG